MNQSEKSHPLEFGHPCSFQGRHIVVECYDQSSMAKTDSAEITKVSPLEKVPRLLGART
jgi:hypothetical protein